MSGAAHRIAEPLLRSRTTADTRPLAEALRAAGPPLLFGLRSWASVSLGLYALNDSERAACADRISSEERPASDQDRLAALAPDRGESISDQGPGTGRARASDRAAAGWLPIPRQGEFAATFAAAHDTPVVSKLMPWVLGNLWPNAARGERLMRGKVIPPGDER
jgi:hypothetical protein